MQEAMMPLFSNQQNQNTAVWEPKAADGRLAQTTGANEAGVFTSDLSVSEYVLLGEAGFEPLGFVVGSSIYHVGLQVSRWGRNQELQVLTQAMYNARENAMARMRAEADHLAADGIVGVQLRMQMYSWGQNCLEFVATGTAVRHLAGHGAHRAPDGRAFTSDLSAQDFFRLLAAGAVPVSFVLGTCVFHIAHQGVLQSLRQVGQNQEMMQFTQGVYEARELALARMQAEAAAAKSGASTRPSSWPPAPRSGGSLMSTSCRKPLPSRRSRSAWTIRPGGPGGRSRGEKLLCGGDQPDLFFPPVWSQLP
jgi:uncharacterized protein YbjQ (UPF0145 family)